MRDLTGAPSDYYKPTSADDAWRYLMDNEKRGWM